MFRLKIAAFAAAVLGSVGVATGIVVGAASATTPDLYLSPTGSDTAACTQTAPCKSFPRAFALAQPGNVVEVADGQYGCGTLSGSKTADVTFRAASGATPAITCELALNASHVVFDGINIAGVRSTSGSFATLRNVNITCEDVAPYKLWDGKCSAGLFLFNTTHDFTMVGGSIGPTWDSPSGPPGNSQIGHTLNNCTGCVVRNITLDGVRFHDNRRQSDASHTECLMVGGGNGVTIKNSTFERCAVFGIFYTWWNFVTPQYAPATNVLLDGNTFGPLVGGCTGCTVGYYDVTFADYQPNWTNVLVKGNSFATGLRFAEGSTKTNVVVSGNRGAQLSYGCAAGVTYTNNLWDNGVKCGKTDGSSGGTTTTTPAPTTTAVTTTAPPTTVQDPPPYKPACAKTCDEQLAALTAKVDDLNAQIATLKTAADENTVTISTLRNQVAALNAKIAAAVAALSP